MHTTDKCIIVFDVIARVHGSTYNNNTCQWDNVSINCIRERYIHTHYRHTLSPSLSLSICMSHLVLIVYKLIDIKDARVYIHQSTPRIYRYRYFSRGGGVYYPLYTRLLVYIYIYIVISFSLYLFFHSPKSLFQCVAAAAAAVNFPLVNEASAQAVAVPSCAHTHTHAQTNRVYI